jgi:hypothetical protein
LPDIVRESNDEESINREGLTYVELNKCLMLNGFGSSRRRVSGGILDRQNEWQGRRWVDPTNVEDIQHVVNRLHSLNQHPEARSLTTAVILDVLSKMQTKAVSSESKTHSDQRKSSLHAGCDSKLENDIQSADTVFERQNTLCSIIWDEYVARNSQIGPSSRSKDNSRLMPSPLPFEADRHG